MATTKPVYLQDLHFEHRLWTNQLSFYKQEVNIFENYLGEVSVKNTNHDAMAGVEHFQNQFIRQKEVIDELVHDIKIHEQNLAQFAKEHPVAIDHVHFHDHTSFRDRMEMFEKIYAELKMEFRRFLAKWM